MAHGHGQEVGTEFTFLVDDLAAEVARLRAAGVQFRNDIVTGPGRITNFAD
jgi:hypothetical protein